MDQCVNWYCISYHIKDWHDEGGDRERASIKTSQKLEKTCISAWHVALIVEFAEGFTILLHRAEAVLGWRRVTHMWT